LKDAMTGQYSDIAVVC